MKKKANYQDVLTFMEVAFALIIAFSLVLVIYDEFNTNVQALDSGIANSDIKTTSSEYNSALPLLMDGLFVGLLIIFVGFSVFASRRIPSSPLFILVAIFSIFGITFVSMYFVENFWAGWNSQSAIASVTANMTLFPFIMNNFRYFMLLYAVGVTIALLSKEDENTQ